MAPADYNCGPEELTDVVGDDNYWRQRHRRRRYRETKYTNLPLAFCCSASASQLEFKRKRRKNNWTLTDESKRDRSSVCSCNSSSSEKRRSPADGRDNKYPTTREPSTIEEGEIITTTTTKTNTTLKAHKSPHLHEAKVIQLKYNIREQCLVANGAPKRVSAAARDFVHPARGLIVLSILLSLFIFNFILIFPLATQLSARLQIREQNKHPHHLYQPDRRFYFITFASANEITSAADLSPSPTSLQDSNTNADSNSNNNNILPEPQALAYNLLHELGSGDGPGYPRGGGDGGQRQTFADPSSSVSPSLIEARCWNNYETDNDCKQLNVITGPSGGAGGGSDSLQNQHQQQPQSTDDSDQIITPIVMFEASSTIEPQQASSYQDDLFGGRQYFAEPPTTRQSSSSSDSNNRHRTNYQQQQTAPSSPIDANDFYSAPPQTATILPPVRQDRPVTRPSVTNSRVFVATPSPGASRKATKTTTMGRKCRDENDADCDEPDDDDSGAQNSHQLSSAASGSDNIDNDDDNRNAHSGTRQDNGLGQDSSNRPLGGSAGGGGGESIEPGSGGGAPYSPADDNDDSTDDGDDDDDDSNGDSNEDADSDNSNDVDNGGAGGNSPSANADGSLDSGSGDSIDSSQESVASPANTRLLEVTSISPHQSAAATTTTDRSVVSSLEQDLQQQRATEPSVSRPAATHRMQTGAEIEVVVHSTLPPSFPSTTRHTTAGESGSSSSSSTTTTTTTPMPDETFTSKPIFPSSTSGSSSDSQSEEGGPDDDNRRPQQAGGSSTTEIDLYTFKPIPIPVEQNYPGALGRPYLPPANSQDQLGSANQQQGSGTGESTDSNEQQQQGGGGGTQEVSAQHIHEPAHRKPSMIYEGRGTFDDGWTTRRPLRAHSQLAQGSAGRDAGLQQQNMGLDSFMMPGKRTAASKTHIGTDMLPTLLLYASIIILVSTALIFVVMAYVFWRRNTLRRRALLQKAHMLDRNQPPHMIQSMSHASQLMHGNLGGGAGGPGGHMQPGLLSTYAPGKGMTVDKVTTSLVKPAQHADEMRMLRNAADDAENDGDDDDDDASDRLFNNKGNSKDQLVGDGNGGDPSMVDGSGRRREGQLRHRLNNGGPLKQSSGSTDEPTTSSGGGGSSSQQTQDSQQQFGAGPMGPDGQQQQQHPQQYQNGQVKSAHYPNSLSDGRQNSNSISDSQCSPDTSIGGPPQNQHQTGPPPPMHLSSNTNNNNNLNHHQMSSPLPHQYQQQQQQRQQMGPGPQAGPMMMGPMYPPPAPTPFRPMYVDASGPGPGSLGSPLIGMPAHRRAYPMNGSAQNGFAKPRFVTSRSIEDISHAPPSQHVGFVHPNQHQQQQQQVLYHQSPANLPPQQHVMLPHLIQHRPSTQFSPQHQANYQQQNVQLGSPMHQHQQMISPQRIAMNPLATLSRRYPPGTGLNRTTYSEDSSSFMTTSPSLARTSSSSSFAFNLSKQHSVSSIKAKPIVDASGRVTNDYTTQANFDGLPPPTPVQLSNGNGTAGPPVFGLSDRSEAWYV